MDNNEDMLFRQLDEENRRLNNENGNLRNNAVSMFSADQVQSIVEWQLDLQKELERIDNLLRGKYIKRDGKGNEMWVEPQKVKSKILTDTGVEMIMNTITFTINKNNILTNFSEDEINWKMEDFLDVLADDIFMDYENVFYKPSIEELINEDIELIEEMEKKYNIKVLADGSIKPNSLSDELRDKLNNQVKKKIKEIKSKTDRDYLEEAQKIYSRNKKKYPLLVELIKISVHSTLLRALNGGERETLRKIVHVTESKSAVSSSAYKPQTQGQFKLWNPTTWTK